MSGALGRLDSVGLSERPRMADFGRWAPPAEPALRWPHGAFLAAYGANRREAEETALDGNVVASAILALMTEAGTWRGTAAELILHLRKRYPTLTEASEAFPRQPAAFGAELRRVAPLLRGKGVVISHDREGKGRRRIVELKMA